MTSDKKTIELLNGLGCSQNDALTYIALLQHGNASIRKVSAHTGINRGTTYEVLKHLVVLGLASVKRVGSRERYTAESPEKIFDIIREKRRDLMEISSAANNIVPDLLARQAGVRGQPMVRYFEGDEGAVAILKDVLQTCAKLPKPEYYAYSSKSVVQYLYRRFPQFTERRVNQGIYVKVIAVGDSGEVAALAERRALKGVEEAELSTYTIIYGNKVATLSTTDDDVPYGVVIEDSGAASMQRLLFNYLWSLI